MSKKTKFQDLTAHEKRMVMLFTKWASFGPNVAWRYVAIRLGPVPARCRAFVVAK